MKTLIFYTSHRQTWEIAMSGLFLARMSSLRDIDVTIHCNCPKLFSSVRLLSCAFNYTSRSSLILSRKNAGYTYGHIEAIVDSFHYFTNYDLIVHLHPDVFIVDERSFRNLLDGFLCDPARHLFYVSYMRNFHSPDNTRYCTDFFAFRPDPKVADALARYSEDVGRNLNHPELFLARVIQEGSLPCRIFKRTQWMGEGPRCIEETGLWHEHNWKRVTKFLLKKNINRLLGRAETHPREFYFPGVPQP